MFPVAALIGLSSNYNISVRATVRNQPYANQSVPSNACSPRS
jgi:hypothetical protein